MFQNSRRTTFPRSVGEVSRRGIQPLRDVERKSRLVFELLVGRAAQVLEWRQVEFRPVIFLAEHGPDFRPPGVIVVRDAGPAVGHIHTIRHVESKRGRGNDRAGLVSRHADPTAKVKA